MAAVDIYNYAAEANPNDIKNTDPTVLRSGAVTVVFRKTLSVTGTKTGSRQSYE